MHTQVQLGYIKLGCANVEDINPHQMKAYFWPSELKWLIKISNIWTSNLLTLDIRYGECQPQTLFYFILFDSIPGKLQQRYKQSH